MKHTLILSNINICSVCNNFRLVYGILNIYVTVLKQNLQLTVPKQRVMDLLPLHGGAQRCVLPGASEPALHVLREDCDNSLIKLEYLLIRQTV